MTVFHRGTHPDYVAFIKKHRHLIQRQVIASDRVIVYHDPIPDGEGTVFVRGVFPCST